MSSPIYRLRSAVHTDAGAYCPGTLVRGIGQTSAEFSKDGGGLWEQGTWRGTLSYEDLPKPEWTRVLGGLRDVNPLDVLTYEVTLVAKSGQAFTGYGHRWDHASADAERALRQSYIRTWDVSSYQVFDYQITVRRHTALNTYTVRMERGGLEAEGKGLTRKEALHQAACAMRLREAAAKWDDHWSAVGEEY